MFDRRVEGVGANCISWALVSPKGAMRLIVMNYGDEVWGDVSYHLPCLDRDCDDDNHGGCDLFGGESDCHCGSRSIGEVASLDDDRIFELLERLYETDVACYS